MFLLRIYNDLLIEHDCSSNTSGEQSFQLILFHKTCPMNTIETINAKILELQKQQGQLAMEILNDNNFHGSSKASREIKRIKILIKQLESDKLTI